MASSCSLSLIPYFSLSRLLHRTSKLVLSFSLYPPLRHKTLVVASPTSSLKKAGEALQCATCLQGIITNAIASLNGKLDNLTD